MPTLDILAQIFSGIKKLPGNALGAPVDLSNTVVNAMKAGYGYAGSKMGLIDAKSLPELEENPIGGSSWINKQFGLDKSTGAVDELTQFVGGLATPGNLAGVAKAVILPAALLHDASTLKAAQRLIDAGREDQVYKATKIFPSSDPKNPELRAVLPDTNASLQSVGGTLRDSNGNVAVSDLASNLGHVIDHPDLFKAVPALSDTPVMGMKGPGGSYNTATTRIKLGEYPTEERFMSTALHEAQHAIQANYGFTGGSSPEYFMRDPTKFQRALSETEQLFTEDKAIQDNKVLQGAYDKAREHYMNTAGEQEARIVQQQFTSGDYSVSPAKTIRNLEAGGEKPIYDKASIPKVDDDEAVRKIIDYYNPQTGL